MKTKDTKEKGTVSVSSAASHSTAEPTKKAKKKRLALWLSVSVIGLAALCGGIGLFVFCTKPVVTEVGEVPDYSHITSNGFVSRLCSVDTPLSSVDTSKTGIIEIPLTLFGFLKASSQLSVEDTVPPEITVWNLCVTTGVELTEEMFIQELRDRTEVILHAHKTLDSDTAREREVLTFTAWDEGGNSTRYQAELTVVDSEDFLVFEYGVSAETIKKTVVKLIPPLENGDFSVISGCGEYLITGREENTVYYAKIGVWDTTAPTADVRSFDLVLGDTVSDDELITNISDHSEVTVEFLTRADFETAGEYAVNIRLSDPFENCTEYTSTIRIHDIQDEITAEMMSSDEALAALIFRDDRSRDWLSFPNARITNDLWLGTHVIFLEGAYNPIPVSIRLVDTTAPVFTVDGGSYLVGSTLEPEDFVSACSDTGKVTYSFKEVPDTSREGIFEITIVAQDDSGNSSEQAAEVSFFRDTTPPEIRGCRNISLKVGETWDYGLGVTAHDSVWGDVEVGIDASRVNRYAAGVYPLVYTASDRSGNTAKETVYVTVTDPDRFCLNVSNILQMPALPNGCEVVSLAIALRYAGYSVDPIPLYDEFMPKSPLKNGDPWTTYVGNAKGLGFGCYAPCVAETGNAYLASVGASKTVSDVSGQPLSYYKEYIDRGIPVVVWGTIQMNCNPHLCWEAVVNGKYVVWHSYSHCLVLIGYTKYTYIFCDPLRGIVEYSKAAAETSFEINFRQACIVN